MSLVWDAGGRLVRSLVGEIRGCAIVEDAGGSGFVNVFEIESGAREQAQGRRLIECGAAHDEMLVVCARRHLV